MTAEESKNYIEVITGTPILKNEGPTLWANSIIESRNPPNRILTTIIGVEDRKSVIESFKSSDRFFFRYFDEFGMLQKLTIIGIMPIMTSENETILWLLANS